MFVRRDGVVDVWEDGMKRSLLPSSQNSKGGAELSLMSANDKVNKADADRQGGLQLDVDRDECWEGMLVFLALRHQVVWARLKRESAVHVEAPADLRQFRHSSAARVHAQGAS